MLVPNKRSEAAKCFAFLPTGFLDPVKHLPPETVELQLVNWPGVRVELDRQQVETKCREPESRFVNVEPDQLIVENSPKVVGVGTLFVGTPMLRYQLANVVSKKMPPPTAGSRTLADLPIPRRSRARNDARTISSAIGLGV